MKKLYKSISFLFLMLLSVSWIAAQQKKIFPSERTSAFRLVKPEKIQAESGRTFSRIQKENKGIRLSEDKTAYGIVLFDSVRQERGLVSFSMNRPLRFTSVYEDISSYAGACAYNKYYYFSYGNTEYGSFTATTLNALDLSSWEVTPVADISYEQILVTDMTYDYSKNTLFAVELREWGSELVQYSLKEKRFLRVGTFGNVTMVTLAATYKGELYGISAEGFLYRINKPTGALEKIGFTGYFPQYAQSMEFDHTDEALYWACITDDGSSSLKFVDITTGIATDLAALGNTVQMTGLYIPYTLPDVDAPANPENLSGTPGTDGSHTVTLNWTHPSRDVMGAPLARLTEVKIYRDGEVIHTFSSPAPGASEEWTDTDVPEGFSTYKIVAEGTAGTGLPAVVTVFVGRDVPGYTESLKAERTNGGARISWEAPVKGWRSGWYDRTGCRYKIVRYPDGTVLTDNCTDTEFTDPALSETAIVSYGVQPVCQDGEGPVSRSNDVFNGPSAVLPFFVPFDTQEEFNRWMVVDKNRDGITWKWIEEDPEEKGYTCAGYWFSINSRMQPDEWLISPPLQLEKDTPYKLTFDIRAALPEFPERIRIYIGVSPVPETMQEIGDFTVSDTTRFIANRILLSGFSETADRYLAFRAYSEPDAYVLSLKNVLLEKNAGATIEGIVTDGTAPVPGAVVSVSHENEVRTFTTDEAGHYYVDYAVAGTHTLEVLHHGYYPVTRQITLLEVEHRKENVELLPVPVADISGTVTDETGAGVAGAFVHMRGYDQYTARSDDNGRFVVRNVYRSDDYRLTIIKPGYSMILRQVDASGEPQVLENLALNFKILPPSALHAEEKDNVLEIRWNIPVDTYTFKYDDGVPKGIFGYDSMTSRERTVIGSIFRNPAVLTSVSWYLSTISAPRERIKVYIFDLDEAGDPVPILLFSDLSVLSKDGEWATLEFPEPLYAPNGFLFAIGYEGNLWINRDEDSEVDSRAQCYAQDYMEGFDYLVKGDIKGYLMLRAEGASFEAPASVRTLEREPVVSEKNDPSLYRDRETAASVSGVYPGGSLPADRPVCRYEVYRLQAGEEDTEDRWTLLTEETTPETRFADTEWNRLEAGIYRYGIKTVYPNGQVSVPSFTDPIEHRISTVLKVQVIAADNRLPVPEASIRMDHADGTHRYDVSTDDSGYATLTIRKGVYRISISKTGFEKFEKEELDYTTEETYEPEPFALVRQLVPVRDLVIENGERETEKHLYWNMQNIRDDFEGHEDFAVNSPGAVGWQYRDEDGKNTTAIMGTTFPHVGEPMAYLVFNPLSTLPPMAEPGEDLPIDAHSGDKFLASLAATGIGSSFRNDDYLISPVLRYSLPFTVSFWAKTYSKKYGLEIIRVGYSESGTESGDFQWISGNLEVPAEWTYYQYNVPENARYLSVNCISPDRYMLMLDDISIGRETNTETTGAKEFEIYLDGQPVGTASGNTYTFTGLPEGSHTAGVKAVYLSGASEMVTRSFVVSGSGLESTRKNQVGLYPNPARSRIHISGEYVEIRIFGPAGRLQGVYADQMDIAVEDWESGIYLARIITSAGVEVHKIVVE